MPATHSNETVFVYGTLTDSDRVEAVLRSVPNAEYDLGSTAVLEGLHRVEGEYPTLAPGDRTEGQLLSIDERGLEALDRYEGVDQGLYERIAVPREDSDADEVWVYVGDPDRLGVAERVDWPDGSSLEDRVRTYVSNRDIVIRTSE
ncbi:gamma-glutamylcyclotransferase [Natronococcus sp. A-GB1]|uniref:gamma-glutamylcyclotransferase family protein n=1 Tax=Natronococcus sp. A-GB1 TaxID=3037648 RepID=UPI00241F689D|nr:gamma-glutamylcyclotransferase family protein [Natronococcus sp. A-GB1]MDG5758688.1 gamma-glutamylcyclotransferase [Natronococcus sp. A-GB1]